MCCRGRFVQNGGLNDRGKDTCRDGSDVYMKVE
jgi:hypothetical protein